MNTLMTLTNTNQKSTIPSKEGVSNDTEVDDKTSTDDFVTILFGQIKNSAKNTSKDNTTSLSTNNDEKDSKNSDEKRSSDEILLDEILSITNQLKSDGTSTNTENFPKFSDKMDKILTDETARNDFKNVKNLDDVYKLSKKYNLGLKDVNITQDNIDSFKKDFPELDTDNFFETNANDKSEKQTNLKNSMDVEANNKKENFINKISQNNLTAQSNDSQKNILQDFLKNIDTEENISENSNAKKINTAQDGSKTAEYTAEEILSLKDEKNQDKSNINNARIETNQTKKSTQDQILNKFKSKKNISSSSLNNNQTNTSDTKLDSDTKTKTNDTKIESTNNRHEFKNSIQTEDSKTIKNSDTKNSLNNFSSDLKEKTESYKPPMMKITMTLNPKDLGEVDVTLINRGNNLHVNISSNTSTMSLFTQNQAEFKNSLVNMGFTNLEMNFSDQGQNQQNQQNQQNSQKQSNSFEEFNQQEEYESSLELIVPRYV